MFNPEDEDLFRKELEGVKPLVQNRVSIRNSAQGPSEAQLARREAAITDLKRDENLLTTEYVEMVDPHDIIEYKRPGVQDARGMAPYEFVGFRGPDLPELRVLLTPQ